MNRKALVLLLACSLNAAFALPTCFAAQPDYELAHEYVAKAVMQMGGEAALRGLKTVRFEAIGHREMVEQSERPEGPYVVEYDHLIVQLRDLEHQRWKQTITLNGGPFPDITVDTVTAEGMAKKAFDQKVRPGSLDDLQSAQETLELGPERVLFTAMAADDLHAEVDVILQSVPHHVVTFTWRKLPVRLYLNIYTALPTEVEWQSAYPSNTFWSAWGDVTTHLYYSLWWLCPGGIHYPTQWDFERNGLPDHSFTITKISTNVEFPANTFAISDDEKAAFNKRRSTLDDRPLGIPDQPAVEVANDIVHIPGAWNVTLVRQTDGIVVVEAPISSGYSVKVLAEAERRWTGIPVKAVISTSDSWPHLAGVREYVARGIPVYALDLNVAILNRLMAAPRTRFPDALARNPKKPDFRAVAGKTLLGTGPNRIEIYPLRGETSERQMMVYFPEHKLLYGSDPFQKNEQGYTFPQTVWELVHAVEREKLSVDTFFMMHIGPTPWGDLLKAIEEAEKVPAAQSAEVSQSPVAVSVPSPSQNPALVNTCLISRDIQTLAAFYQRVLKIAPHFDGGIYVEFKTGTGILSIFDAQAQERYIPGSAESSANRSAILEFQVNDADREYERLRGIVKTWVKPPTTQPWGTRSIYFRDPDGNLIDFYAPAK